MGTVCAPMFEPTSTMHMPGLMICSNRRPSWPLNSP